MLPLPALPDTAGACQIDLRAGGQGHEFLLAGWSHAEKEYTWTLGKKSLVRLPAPAAACDCSLKFRAGPMVRAGAAPFQRLDVSVNGTLLARLIARAPAQHELFVPAALLAQDSVDIVFHMPDAQPPTEDGSGDSRELGFWLASLEFAPLPAAPPLPHAAARAADKAMLMDLQSLGENCELGFVQRFGGAEPLGLFRWASTPLPNLLAALAARFAGLGEANNLVIEADEASEFQVLDTRYGFRNHSFAFANAGARREDLLKRERVRLPFMARLLIEDLERADKLFCFHDAGRSDRAAIERLVAALGAYGPNSLLWMCPAPAPPLVGTAERLGPRLIRGFVDRFQPLHDVRKPSVAAWMGAIRGAVGIWRGAA